MKKFSKYFLKFNLSFLLLLVILNHLITNTFKCSEFIKSELALLVIPYIQKIIGISNQYIPIALLISIMVILSSFYFLIKKNKNKFKYIIKKGFFAFIAIFIIWGFAGLEQTTYRIGAGFYIDPCADHSQIPGV